MSALRDSKPWEQRWLHHASGPESDLAEPLHFTNRKQTCRTPHFKMVTLSMVTAAKTTQDSENSGGRGPPPLVRPGEESDRHVLCTWLRSPACCGALGSHRFCVTQLAPFGPLPGGEASGLPSRGLGAAEEVPATCGVPGLGVLDKQPRSPHRSPRPPLSSGLVSPTCSTLTKPHVHFHLDTGTPLCPTSLPFYKAF